MVIHKNSCGRGECVVRKVGNGCLSCWSALLVKRKEMSFSKISSYFMFETGVGLFHLKKRWNHGTLVIPVVASWQAFL